MADNDLRSAIEILPGRLYYCALRSKPSQETTKNAHFFTMDNELVYWNFFLDFGPFNMAQLYRFCQRLNSKLKAEVYEGKAIYYYCGPHAHKRTNAAFLITAWSVLYLERSPEEAYRPFRGIYPPFTPFHDASPCVCTYNLTILDCLRGLNKAKHFGFFDFDKFHVEEYEYYEQVENGDLNWIINNKFLAFAGPQNSRELTSEGYYTLTPEDYVPYFHKHNVQLVIRLNKKCYQERKFKDTGINHMELYYLDGSIPPTRVLNAFLEACEKTSGAIAVHCKAGLGRTGTCIACYMMKHYRFTAAEAIGYIRLCRPGSIIGPQQHYLKEMEQTLWYQGDLYRQQQNRKQTGEVDNTAYAGIGVGSPLRIPKSKPNSSALRTPSRFSHNESYMSPTRSSSNSSYSTNKYSTVSGAGDINSTFVSSQGDALRTRRQQQQHLYSSLSPNSKVTATPNRSPTRK